MWVVQRGDLDAVSIHQLRVLGVQPAVLDRLAIKIRAWIWCRERDLDGVRVDLGGKANGFLNRLLRLAREPQNESTMDLYAQFVAVLGKAARNLDPHTLLDVVQDLLVATLVAHEQQAETIILK